MKYLWRAKVLTISRPVYLVAQNMASAQAQVAAHPLVYPYMVRHLHRIDEWDDQNAMTVVLWPEPPPQPDPEEPPPP